MSPNSCCVHPCEDQAERYQRGRDVEELEEDERVHDQIRREISAVYLSCGPSSAYFPDLSFAHGQVTFSLSKQESLKEI